MLDGDDGGTEPMHRWQPWLVRPHSARWRSAASPAARGQPVGSQGQAGPRARRWPSLDPTRGCAARRLGDEEVGRRRGRQGSQAGARGLVARPSRREREGARHLAVPAAARGWGRLGARPSQRQREGARRPAVPAPVGGGSAGGRPSGSAWSRECRSVS
jgi:hypothetical protein